MIVPASKKHIEDMYGKAQPLSMRAFALIEGDKTLGVAGVYFSKESDHVAFVNLSDEGRKKKKDLIRLSRKVIPLLDGLRVSALRDANEPTSESLLRHYGFEQVEGEIWLRQ